MAGKIGGPPNRLAGPLLATMLVLLLGALAVATIVAAGGENPMFGLLTFGGGLIVLLFVGFVLRSAPQGSLESTFGWMRSRDARPENEYRPEARRIREYYGTNAPPTADEVRDLKGGLNNWVPTNVPDKNSRGKRPKR